MHPTAPTAAQIDAWKQQYGDVYALEVEGLTGYVRQPTAADLVHARTSSGGNSLKMFTTLLENCWLGGPAELKTNDGLFLSATLAMGELVTQLIPSFTKRGQARHATRKRK